jgi:hypothetical protein
MKILAIILGIIIVVLLGILTFVRPAKSPTIPSEPPVTGAAISPDSNVRVLAPIANAVIASPAMISGMVTGGGWFFEASFPVKILDADGTVLGTGQAQAQPAENWTSTGTVAFIAKIVFKTPHSVTGTIVLSKDNPSGTPANDESLNIPVRFGSPSAAVAPTGTVRGEVLLGPTCPVESIPPNPQCSPRPYKTTITISKNIQTPVAFKTIQSDSSGTFSVTLPAGEYVFHPQGGSPLPRCEEKLVEVSTGMTNDITINCDTGIR